MKVMAKKSGITLRYESVMLEADTFTDEQFISSLGNAIEKNREFRLVVATRGKIVGDLNFTVNAKGMS